MRAGFLTTLRSSFRKCFIRNNLALMQVRDWLNDPAFDGPDEILFNNNHTEETKTVKEVVKEDFRDKLKTGTHVTHYKFGDGIIIGNTPSTVTINFENVGEKNWVQNGVLITVSCNNFYLSKNITDNHIKKENIFHVRP